jgi:hypothetical protein
MSEDRGRGEEVRTYEVEKVESYYITANSQEEAVEIVKTLDNGSALSVDYRAVFVGVEEGVK